VDIFGDQGDPARVMVLVTAVAALVVVTFGELWRPARNVITIVHEAGHALVALLGLGFAALAGADRITAVLVLCAILLVGVLVMVRNVYGVVLLLIAGGVLFAVSWWANVQIQATFAHLITWFLLLGAVRPIGELQSKRRRGRARDSDADQLARLTGAPGLFWIGMFLMINLGSLVLAAAWLLG